MQALTKRCQGVQSDLNEAPVNDSGYLYLHHKRYLSVRICNITMKNNSKVSMHNIEQLIIKNIELRNQ